MDAETNKWYLPNELWLEVIKRATYAHNEGGVTEWTSNYDPLEMGRKFVCHLFFGWDRSKTTAWLDYNTRRNLTLVSKTWNHLSTPILYRFIFLRKKSLLLHFTALLRNKPEIKQFVMFLAFDFPVWTSRRRQHSRSIAIIQENIKEIYKSCRRIAFVCDMGYSKLISLPVEDHPPQLQALDVASSFEDSNRNFFNRLSPLKCIRFLTLSFTAYEPSRSTPRLSLPKLEILSLMIESESARDIDEYLSESEVPKLHSLHLYLVMGDDRDLLHPLDIIRSTCKNLGHQILTLSIEDKRYRSPTSGGMDKPSFRIEKYLPNLQQLVVEISIGVDALQEMSVCKSIHILDIYDPTTISVERYINEKQDSDADRDIENENQANNDETAEEEVSIISKDLGKDFKNLRLLRFSSSTPDLWGREYATNGAVDGLKAFLRTHGAEIEGRGVSIDLRLMPLVIGESDLSDDESEDEEDSEEEAQVTQ